jgi:NAD(P)-dependent dehydrogenase (short-subunit alcohol dehydrogenase family)
VPVATVLVIGASRGIGLEFARQYFESGDRVLATARDEAGLQRLRDLGATAFRLDVSDPASVSGLAWQLDGEQIDIALYVAGVYSQSGADTPPTQPEFDKLMHTNVLGAMQTIPQVAPLVEAAAQGRGGKFVFLTSGMGQISTVSSSFGWTYRVSKAALNMAVAAAQSDYPKAIMVVMNPGWVSTDMGGKGAPLSPQTSVSNMRKVISGLTFKHKGKFMHHDGAVSSW